MPFSASCVDNAYVDVDNVDIGHDGISRQEVSFFAEPRLELGTEDASLRPFVAGRLGWARKTIDLPVGSHTANGIGAGGLAGLGYQVSFTLAIEAAVTAYYLSFGDFDQQGQTLANSSSSGNALGLRLALVLSR